MRSSNHVSTAILDFERPLGIERSRQTSEARRWTEAPDDNTPRLVRHALRTLVKKGDPDALALLGFAPPDGVSSA